MHGSLHTSHVTVVIGAPDVDGALEAALPLVAVVSDVGHEVGVGAIRLAQHAVLVVSERGGLEPQRAVLLVRVLPLGEIGERLLDELFLVEPGLEEDHVEPDPKLPQVLLLLGAQGLDADDATAAQAFRLGKVGECPAFTRQDSLGDLDEILSVVTALRDLRPPAGCLLDPCPQ